MRLYATTTSERASKGQGGNEYIETFIYDKDRKIIANVLVGFNVKNKTDIYIEFFYKGSIFKKVDIRDYSKTKSKNDCEIDCKLEHLCKGVDCKLDNSHNCKQIKGKKKTSVLA